MDHMKKIHQQNRFNFNFSIVSANLIQIDQLVTEIQNFGNDERLILYINLLRKVRPISITVLQQNSSRFLLYV